MLSEKLPVEGRAIFFINPDLMAQEPLALNTFFKDINFLYKEIGKIP